MNQAQQPCFSKSAPDSFVTFNNTNSSAHVGCIPTVLSKSLNFKPNFIATPNPYITSPAFGPK